MTIEPALEELGDAELLRRSRRSGAAFRVIYDRHATRLGDQLEAAAERSLGSERRRKVGRVGLGVVALTVLAAGTAVATGLFSPRQVAAGLPAGAMIFGGTHPSCGLDADGITYHCTLTTAPAAETSDFRGSKQLIAIDLKIAGGCIGQDTAGMSWDCWIGEEAVRHDILAEDLLGQPELEPGKG
ncbi:MAG: hypothetical protein ABJC39_09650 [Chloroflexota bacterium]